MPVPVIFTPYLSSICRHALFCGLSYEDTLQALALLDASAQNYAKGEPLNRISHPLSAFGLLLSGTVQVYMDDINGDRMIMANVCAGETFGESLCYLKLDAPVFICATSDSVVLWLNPHRLHECPGCAPLEAELSCRFTAILARRTLFMNDRIQILSKNTLRAKLITFFSQYLQRFGPTFDIPFSRADLALYLGADRSALSRELSHLKHEGIIRFDKNHFELLHPFSEKS